MAYCNTGLALVIIFGQAHEILFGLMLIIQVNSYGHVGTDSSPK